MRRLALLAVALCVSVVALAVPAAAAPIDPGRAVTRTAMTVKAHASVLPGATDRAVKLEASLSAVGDRPADGTHSSHLGIIDLGRDTSFNLATIGARELLEPAVTISP